MRPHRPLKFDTHAADPHRMRRGGWLVRRRLVPFAIAAGLAASLPSPQAASAIPPVAPLATGIGEPGTGAPAFPFEIPRSLQTRAATTDTIVWSDVTGGFWAHKAIDYVAANNDWMRDYRPGSDGTTPFKPDRIETRKYFARAVVRAFAPDEAVDPSIRFKDLPVDDRFYPYANVAVKMGWMRRIGGRNFVPDAPVTMARVHRVLVLALGLKEAAAGADAIHTHNGYRFKTPTNFGTTLIGMRLGLRFNHWGNESLDVNPSTQLPRSEVAWSLYRATTLPSWAIADMQSYATIELPNLGPRMRQVVQWGIDYVGYPYVWGGDWNSATPANYCCGPQPIGGFDCSGLTWWLMKHAADGWKNDPPRPYVGWDLPQRTSALMATLGNIGFKRLSPGDIMFYDGNKDGTVDHVDTYIGNGWSLDSSSTPAGVTIMWVGDGWYHDHFVHARRIIPTG